MPHRTARVRPACAIPLLIAFTAPAAADAELDPVFVWSSDLPVPVQGAATRHAVEPRALQTFEPRTLDDLARRLPSAHVPVNSRGEALLFLRGAGERQLGVFFDGALLNVPWDNRFDLGVLPGAVVERAISVSGSVSPRYGVNATSALLLYPRHDLGGARGRVRLSGGSEDLFGAEAAFAGDGVFGVLQHHERDGASLPDDANLPFHQRSDDVRTNTGDAFDTALLRAEWGGGDRHAAATVLLNDLERGIAPESDRARGSRFWRFPDAQLGMAIVSGRQAWSERADLNATVWMQSARQTIDSYADSTYATVADRELSTDRTFGLRAIQQWHGEHASLAASLNLLGSVHRQRDVSIAGQAAGTVYPWRRYAQVAGSAGLDAAFDLSAHCSVEAGLGIDAIRYTDTADKPDYPEQHASVSRAGVACAPSTALQLHATVGRKSRMPTMRELFGTALNRFLLNPDLQPERVTTAEFGAAWQHDAWSLQLTPFVQKVDDAIGERRVGSLRQRINIAGSEIVGIEAVLRATPAPQWTAGIDVTAIDGRRRGFATSLERHLVERPDLHARAHVEFAADAGWRLAGEIEHAGRAYSPDPAGVMQPLPRSTQWHLHARHPLGAAADIALHLRNLTDELVVPQSGLPAAGRSVDVSVAWRW